VPYRRAGTDPGPLTDLEAGLFPGKRVTRGARMQSRSPGYACIGERSLALLGSLLDAILSVVTTVLGLVIGLIVLLIVIVVLIL
jgi:hypothetical protein